MQGQDAAAAVLGLDGAQEVVQLEDRACAAKAADGGVQFQRLHVAGPRRFNAAYHFPARRGDWHALIPALPIVHAGVQAILVQVGGDVLLSRRVGRQLLGRILVCPLTRPTATVLGEAQWIAEPAQVVDGLHDALAAPGARIP